ncbi:MAG: lysophospholipid acyltransferase family protein, partial [Gammaproteobacteria bacterium]
MVTRLIGLTLHVAGGVFLALLLVTVQMPAPRMGSRLRAGLARWWLRTLGRLLGVRVFAYGEPVSEPVLYVANHISWLDIIVLAEVVRADFVAKQEVRGWPLFGWLAQVGGTLFVRRRDSSAARRMEEHMTFRLAAGRNLILFPEGTTTSGNMPKPFKPRLFQAAVRTQSAVQPVAISYQGSHGLRSRIAFVGDQGLLENLWSILGVRSLPVTIRFMPPLASKDAYTRA